MYMYPPVHPLPWITAVLHKARPAQVDHGGDDDDGDDDGGDGGDLVEGGNDKKSTNVIFLQHNYFACILIIVNSSSDNGVDRGRRYFGAAPYFHNSVQQRSSLR